MDSSARDSFPLELSIREASGYRIVMVTSARTDDSGWTERGG